ncbi:hypothetical protein RIF29_21888 [Crotalaria pallida]|uniref:Uncharacterized protein n=1 Tax=Crotalaria pallida TaxID=3830 RepID=A0AAN9F3P7_CROPI
MNCYTKTKMLVFTTILLLGLHQICASRLLVEEQWLHKNLIIQSLQRGPVRGSQKNPCSTVPGRSHGRCTLTQMNFAGQVVHAPLLPFPDVVVKFGTASIDVTEKTQKQDSSS